MNDDAETELYDLLGSGELDRERYRRKIEEHIRNNLDDVIASDDVITAPSGKQLRVRVPDIREPSFHPAQTEDEPLPSGIGAGPGGDPIHEIPLPEGDGEGNGASGEGQGGELTVYVPLEEAAAWIFRELELPMVDSKKGAIEEDSWGLTARGRRGAVMDRNHSLKRHLGRTGGDPTSPWSEDDLTFRRWAERSEEVAQAVIVLARDASGSITAEQRYIIRVTCFWTVLWLRHNYPKVQVRFVIHDTEAQEVDEASFFRDRTGGGTKISTGLQKVNEILDDFPQRDWNRFVLYFTDGDNWMEDNEAFGHVLLKLGQTCDMVGIGMVGTGAMGMPLMRIIRNTIQALGGGGYDASPVRYARLTDRYAISGWLHMMFGGSESEE